MATPAERLAASLTRLGELQQDGRRVFRSGDLTRVHRERLLDNGFLREVIKGWLISSAPGAAPGDTTPWFASFWEFCARYSTERFGDEWHLSPEQSLLRHGASTVIPPQVIVYAPGGANNTLQLPFGTSLYDLREEHPPPGSDLTVRDGLRLFRPEAALVRVSDTVLRRNPVETQVVLAGIRDPSDLLRRLLDGGHSTAAGRLAGAFRRMGRPEAAEDILGAMRAAGYDVREHDPFASDRPLRTPGPGAAPIVARLQALWDSCREQVIRVFPPPPGLPDDRRRYLERVDDSYRSDAYHSLSIEGYRVTPDLVARVRSGDWDPGHRAADRADRDALAARGYWQAFQRVRDAVGRIIAGEDPVALSRTDHRDWYRELFQPCVTAGMMEPAVLAGYRHETVLLLGSRHVPPRAEAVREAMPALFDLLAAEPEPSVRAVLAHWLFGYIHPYPDGNGRLARFLMNALLAAGGYPWTVIRVDDRDAYLGALESASTDQDIRPFARFLAGCVRTAETRWAGGGTGPGTAGR